MHGCVIPFLQSHKIGTGIPYVIMMLYDIMKVKQGEDMCKLIGTQTRIMAELSGCFYCDIHRLTNLLNHSTPYTSSFTSKHFITMTIDLFKNLAKLCFQVRYGFSSGELHMMKYITL
jgi:hypothetical protein